MNAEGGIARDDVACPDRRAADGVVGGTTLDLHAMAVAKGAVAAAVGADVVPLHHRRRRIAKMDTIGVARDNVACKTKANAMSDTNHMTGDSLRFASFIIILL